MQENREQGTETFVIEGRNAVLKHFVPDVRLTRFMFWTDARTDR